MIDGTETERIAPAHPEIQLAIAYAPPAARAALSVLFALDERLAGFVARASEPTIGLMRLVWWRDALAAIDTQAPRGEPLLLAAAGAGLSGVDCSAMVEGWEALLDDPDLGPETLALHAQERGGRLFAIAARLMGGEDPRVAAAGEGWALADLARHTADAGQAATILARAGTVLAGAGGRWPAALRPLGMLAALAREDVRRGAGALRPIGSRGRLLRILAHQLTGR